MYDKRIDGKECRVQRARNLGVKHGRIGLTDGSTDVRLGLSYNLWCRGCTNIIEGACVKLIYITVILSEDQVLVQSDLIEGHL